MTLQATAPIQLTQVQTEYASGTGVGLASFLRGGGRVPNTSQNAAVPTALPISLSSLLGSAKYIAHTLSVAPSPVYDSRVRPGSIVDSATVTVTNGTGPFTFSWAWLSGGASIGLSGASTSTCTFNSSVSGTGTTGPTYSGTARCTVTDTSNGYAVTIDVGVTHEYIGSG